MAEKRDMLDDIIDIQNDWNAVKNPLGNVADQIMADPADVPSYNPSDYKDRPRVVAPSCLRHDAGGKDVCHRCLDVCPVKAIELDDKGVKIQDNCRKCGLCIAVCPTEALLAQRQMPKALYDKIARMASTYEQVYVTCTRALGRLPKENEILLPCVGVVSRETWFALLSEYGNISVYLPLGICDKCRTTTGEEAFSDAIADAEDHTEEHIGLEVDEKEMNHEQSRAYKRSQFVSSMTQAGTRLVTRGNPALAGAQAVANRIQKHTNQINALQRSLEQTTGQKNAQERRRLLTQKRKLVLSTLQSHPKYAQGFEWKVPVCDTTRCTMCGDCAKVCPLHACEIDDGGHFSVEPTYCVNCGACVTVCEEHALTMQAIKPETMVIPDPEKEKAKAQKAQIEAAKKKSKKTLDTSLKALETFGEELSKEYKK